MNFYYYVRYAGCDHTALMPEKEFLTGAKGQQLNPETMTKEDLHMCNACLNAERGYCSESVLHPIAAARKLSPLEVFDAGFLSRARG
jgi:hypothetical protein